MQHFLIGLLLSWAGLVMGAPDTPDTPGTTGAPPARRFLHSMTPPEMVYFLYHVDFDAVDFSLEEYSPAELRRRGGFLALGESVQQHWRSMSPTYNPDREWGYQSRVGMMVHRWVTVEVGLEARIDEYLTEAPDLDDGRHAMVYRIAAAPNMVPRGPRGRYYEALSGIFWSQVQAYAFIDAAELAAGQQAQQGNYSLAWQDNDDYDPRWAQFGPSGPQPLLSGLDLPASTTARELARTFLSELTGPQNDVLDDEQRETLRELMDWNTELEPSRDFPLIRRVPDTLARAAVRSFDWSVYGLARELRIALTFGIPTAAQCLAAVAQIEGSRQRRPRTRRDDGAACDRLDAMVRDQRSLITTGEDVHACSHFNRLQVRLVMDSSWLFGYGTNDDILIAFAKERGTLLAESPSAGQVEVRDVDLATTFGSGNVSVRHIRAFRLWSEMGKSGKKADGWRFKGVTLIGHCAGSGRVAIVDKYAAVSQDVERFGDPSSFEGAVNMTDWHWEQEDAQTATLAVQPPGRPHACSRFSAVKVILGVGSGFTTGTWDDVKLCLDDRPCVVLATAPSSGSTNVHDIDLASLFGSDVIPAPGFRALRLLSVTGDGRHDSDADEWRLKSLFLYAKCAGSPGLVVVAPRPGLVDSDVRRVPGQRESEVLRANLTSSDWLWTTAQALGMQEWES